MKRKIILCTIVFIIVTICSFNIVNADEETETLKVVSNIDEENNLTITLKASKIKLLEGTLDYDSDVMEFIGIEGKNDWQVGKDQLKISMVSNEDTNTEEKDIAVLNFKIVNPENIIDEDITINSIKYTKDDNTTVENRSLKINIVLDDYIAEDEEDLSDDEDTNIEEQGDDDLFDGDTETDGEENYAGDEDSYNDEEEANQEEENQGQNSGSGNDLNGNENPGDRKDIETEENKEFISDKSTSGKETSGKDTTLIDKILPNTGSIVPYIVITLIVISAGASVIVYKKIKGINYIER